MNLKRIAAILTAAALTISISAVSVSAEENFTSAKLKEYVLSGDGKSNVTDSEDRLTPVISGKVSFSKPFKFPGYDTEKKTAVVNEGLWCSAIFSEGKPVAMATFSYQNNEAVMGAVLYFPDELVERILDGETFSVFMVDANAVKSSVSDNGSLVYAVSPTGENIYLMPDSWTDMRGIDPYALKTDKADYERLSKYNVISADMKKTVTVKYDGKSGLESGGTIRIESAKKGHGYGSYKGSAKFIATEQGYDESGRMVYTLAAEDKPNNPIKIGGSERLYILCALGGTEPAYKICSAENPEKVLYCTKTKTESGTNIRAKNWTSDDTQMWNIHILEK